MLKALFAFLVKLALAVFYRRIDVSGLSRLPMDRPILITANHFNSLADAWVLIAAIPRRLSFGAAVFLFAHPVMGRLMRLMGCVPIYRAIDEGADPRKNAESLSELENRMRMGEGVVLFPEGVSKLEPRLQKIKVGAARLAFAAESNAEWALGLEVVPVGLQYEAPGRWRSEVRVQIGEPISLREYHAAYEEHARKAMGAFTQQLEARLRSLSLHAESWEERGDALLAARCYLAELRRGAVRHAVGDGSAPRAVAAGSETAEMFLAWSKRMEERRPGLIQRLRRRLRRMDRALHLLNLGVEELDIAGSRSRLAREIARRALLWTLGLPLAAWGIINSYPAEKVIARVGRRYRGKELSSQATWLLFPGLFIAPLCYLLQSVILACFLLLLGVSAPPALVLSLVYFVSLGPAWAISLRVRDIRHRGMRWATALAISFRHRRAVSRLLNERLRIARMLERLVELEQAQGA